MRKRDVMPHASRLTPHGPRLTPHASRPNDVGGQPRFRGARKWVALSALMHCYARPDCCLPGISNHSPGWSTTGVAGVSLFTRAAQALASWVIGGKVL